MFMKKPYKLLTIVGTRPELIKLSVVLQKFEKYFNHVLVHTGQNYDFRLNKIFFRELKITKPNYFLNCAGSTSLQTIANVISKTDKVLLKEKPDAIVVYGDTNSCLSVIAAIKSDKCCEVSLDSSRFSFVSTKPIKSVVIKFAMSFASESECAFSNKSE